MDNLKLNPKEAFYTFKDSPYTPSVEPVEQIKSPLMQEYMNYMSAIFTGDMSYFDKKGPSMENENEDEEVQNDIQTKGFHINMKNPETAEIADYIQKLPVSDRDKEYLYKLGARESSLNPKARQGSHRGIYQFNNDSLKTVGISLEDYDTNVSSQMVAALEYKKVNLQALSEVLPYIGTTFKGVPITENGLAAAAHLLGAGTVKRWFNQAISKDKKDPALKDALGTTIYEYLRLFA